METSENAPTLTGSTKVSVLQDHLDESAEQLKKLATLFDQLEARLQPVMGKSTGIDGGATEAELPPASPIVSSLRVHTSMIKIVQAAVQRLLNELEV